jgi:hypothetical protein
MKKFEYGIFRDCFFEKETYRNNGNTAIQIYGRYDEEYDEPISTLSVNTEETYPDGMFVLKNYGENEDANTLVEQGFFEVMGMQLVGRFVCPVVRITEKFKEYCCE